MYYEGEIFKQKDFSDESMKGSEYEDCEFHDCQFRNTDMTDTKFISCQFIDCEIINPKTLHTALREVQFIGSKLLGVQFDVCADLLFDVSFERCQLEVCNFYQRVMKKANFRDSKINECDFTEVNLSEAHFSSCDLFSSTFDRTNLMKADLTTATNFIIDPESNQVRGAKFSIDSLPGLLAKYGLKIS